MKGVFPPEWRTQSRRKRKFYATYMRWLERIGFVVVLAVLAAFLVAFNYKVDDLISADGVKIEPFATPIDATQPTLVAKLLVSDFDEVQKGQPLMEVVEGDDAIRKFGDWRKLQDLRAQIGSAPEVAALLTRYPEPPTRVIAAPAAGTVRIDAKALALPQDAKATLAKVVDYRDLRLQASLAGQTAPAAQVGQWARVSAIAIEPDADTLFRAVGQGKPILSGRLMGDKVQAVLQKSLIGRTIRLRDDVPLKVTDIKDVQIDATAVDAPGGDPNKALSLDPPSSLSLQAQVIDGKPAATVQVAEFPDEIDRAAVGAVSEAAKGRAVRQFDGTTATLRDLRGVHMVVTVKATELDGSAGEALTGATVGRTFDATLKVVEPPAALVQAVRQADENGKAVTARVELRTGSRPIAFLLLKKS